MIKILTFAPMPPTITGGIEEYAYSVIKEISQQGANVEVITSCFNNENGKFASASNKDEIRYQCVPSFILFKRPFPKGISWLFYVRNAIRASDIIHIHMPYPFLESYAAFLAKIHGKKIIITYHMDAKIDAESDTTSLLHSIVEKTYAIVSAKWPLLFSDIVCTNTRAYAENSPILSKYLHKTKVIHQGIRKDLYDFLNHSVAQNMRLKFLDGKYDHIVTFVGRLVPYKGLPYLIDAIRIINNEKILFLIGGNGPQKEYLKEIVKSYNLSNVSFIGYVKDEELFNLFAASDLVVSPSISELESTPISLLSALATGTSVIGTSIGGTAETVPNDNVKGTIIPIKDADVLAKTIVAMLKKQNKSSNIDERYFRFWNNVASDYLETMNKILNRDAKYVEVKLKT